MKRWLFILPFVITPIWCQNNLLQSWQAFAQSKQSATLINWLQCMAGQNLQLKKCKALQVRLPAFHGKLGLFITILVDGRVAGCYGSFYHRQSSPYPVLAEYLRAALREDPRHPPLDAPLLARAHFLVTIAGRKKLVAGPEQVDIHQDGLILTAASGRQSVYVPDEIKSRQSLHYIMRKQRIIQIEIFEAVTIQ